ncbi:hypothetical protein LSAT2_005038 [Lamellibrachia satsuma]|nr:hypothetical protein LSAT2_005038 [Lamellibrachia satsuma]
MEAEQPTETEKGEEQNEDQGGKDEEQGGKDEERGGKVEEQGGKDEEQGGKDEEQGGKDEERRGKDEEQGGSEELQARDKWSGKFDFVMSALSLAVGMGNVWRFPYMCYRNGGGAFLVPYLIMVVLAGIPLMFLEFTFGQYGSSGIITIWKVAPLFEGRHCSNVGNC